MKPNRYLIFFAMGGAVLAYCAAPWFGFVFDDRKQVLANPTLLHLGSIAGYFTHAGGYLAGDLSYYRPLFGMWMNLNYFFFGLHPAGWHMALLLLHAVVAYLCYRLVLALIGDQPAAALAALLFAVHPIHVESVAWISGSTDPLAAVFILLAFLFYLAAQNKLGFIFLSLLAFVASLLCKETALLFPLLILAYELLPGKDSHSFALALKRCAPYVIVAVAYLALRIHVLGAFSHTLTLLPPKVLFLTLPSVAAFYLRLLFLPAGLSPFYDTPYITSASFTSFIAPVLILLAFIALLVWWIRRMDNTSTEADHYGRQAAFFALWTVLFLVPAFNLSALDSGEIAHDRYLYLPSIGFCALAAIALKQLAARFRLSLSARRLAVVTAGFILCTATFAQSLFWKNDLSLYQRGAALAPMNINAQNNLANAYLESGNFELGIATHQKILKLNPRFVDSYFNLGLAYYNLGNFAQAQSYFQQAIALRPAATSYFYLGVAQFKLGDLATAERSLQAALQLDQRQPDFYAVLGVLYETENKFPLALQAMENALSLNPQNQNVRNQVIQIKHQLGQE